MLLTLRHEWRLKSTEKYALDRVSGVSWEFSLFVLFSLSERPIAPYLVQVWRRNDVNCPATFGRVSQGWPFPPAPDADFGRPAFFIGSYREFAVFSSRDIRPVFIEDRANSRPTNVGSFIECARDVPLRSLGAVPL